MNEVKVIKSETYLTIICPSCRKIWKQELLKFEQIGSKYILKCKCSCGEIFKAVYNRRRHDRKSCILKGNFLHESSMERGKIALIDISISGAGLTLETDLKPEIGEAIIVHFHLEDEGNSYLAKRAIIRNIRDNFMGIEFFDENYQKEKIETFLAN